MKAYGSLRSLEIFMNHVDIMERLKTGINYSFGQQHSIPNSKGRGYVKSMPASKIHIKKIIQ